MGLWYSDFDGDAWEGVCDRLLALKHGPDYEPISDKGGDLGLDGLSLKDGYAYQMYGQEPENKEPTNGVRSKIHTDLQKLKTYAAQIREIIGDKKIKRWILLLNKQVPHNNLHAYAKKKGDEVKTWGLPFIDDDFRVIIQPPSYLETEYVEFQKRRDDKVEIESQSQPVPGIEALRSNEKFISVFKKFRKVASSDEEAEKLAYSEVKNFFEYSMQLSEIEKKEPEYYSAIEEVRSDVEYDAEQGSILAGSFVSFSQTKTDLSRQLAQIMDGRLGDKTRRRLQRYIIADWLVRCPLDFKQGQQP